MQKNTTKPKKILEIKDDYLSKLQDEKYCPNTNKSNTYRGGEDRYNPGHNSLKE